MTGLDGGRVQALVRARCPSAKVQVRDSVETTQELAFRMAEYGAADGSLVVAGEQTAGRGRLGRTWSSPPGRGLWCSLVLRPAPPGPSPTVLVAAVALAVAEALDPCGVRALLRWPNDLVVGGRKLGGLLLETRDYDERAPLLVLGVGINTTLKEEDLAAELRPRVTSVLRETGTAPEGSGLLDRVHGGVLDACRRAASSPQDVDKAFGLRAAHVGDRVSLLDGTERRTGVLRGVSPLRGVELEGESGQSLFIRAEHAREIRVLGASGDEVS